MVNSADNLKFLPDEKVREFIGELMKLGEVYAPVLDGPIADLRKIGDPSDVALDFDQTRQSVRDVVEPQSEVLLTYGGKTGSFCRETLPKGTRRIVLWCRPCEARAVSFLDDNFDDAPSKDPYYSSRRGSVLMIGLGCGEPFPYCFCSSVGGDPFGVDELDILMTRIGGGYLLAPFTERGREVEKAAGGLLRAPSKGEEEEAVGTQEAARVRLSGRVPRAMEAPGRLANLFDSPIWKKWGEKCIGCGICTYLCPTCWCFDINDIESKGKGYRLRTWDSCQFPLFTLHTSGHNPRPDKASRVRQRVMHKFSYHPTNYGGRVACVGCGRCSELCPMDIDLKAILNDVIHTGDGNG